MADVSLYDIFTTGAAAKPVAATTKTESVKTEPVPEPPKKKKKSRSRSAPKKPEPVPPPPPPAPASETRHCPGYSMLRVERDKLERSRLALVRRNETRAAQGKPAPTVCSILNDSLIEFYANISAQFNTRFGKYLQETKK